jgi:hypothetical protein
MVVASRFLRLAATLSMVAAGVPLRAQEPSPQTAPSRDVDITYMIVRPDQRLITDRRRWLAEQHLRRIDGPHGSASIFDLTSGELTLLNHSAHTYRTLQGAATKRMSPPEGVALRRGGESKIAGVTCIDWSWIDATELHTACMTPDGVLLRLVIDGKVVAEARTVLYAPQPREIFEVPLGYEPALAPEGSPGGD